MKEESNVNSQARGGLFNIAQAAINKKYKKKLKQTTASAHLVRCRLRSVKAVHKEPERLSRKGVVKEMSFKSGVKDRGSDR